jgi:hypothetical protein
MIYLVTTLSQLACNQSVHTVLKFGLKCECAGVDNMHYNLRNINRVNASSFGNNLTHNNHRPRESRHTGVTYDAPLTTTEPGLFDTIEHLKIYFLTAYLILT